MMASLSKGGSLRGLFEGSNVPDSDANNPANTVQFFSARGLGKRSARAGGMTKNSGTPSNPAKGSERQGLLMHGHCGSLAGYSSSCVRCD